MKLYTPKTRSPDGQKLWSTIEELQLPFTGEYLEQKYNWDSIYARSIIREYKKFVFLALISPEPVTPSIDIDEVWHAHILHTRAYAKFSTLIGRQLEHDPGMPNARGEFQGQYRATLRLYGEVFGDEPPAAFWPRAA